MSLVTMTRPDGATVEVESNDAVHAWCADSWGRSLGLIEPTADVTVTSGPPPSASHVWSGIYWVYQPTLSDLRAERLAVLKAQRDAAVFGGFAWDSSRFDSDETAQSRLLGLFVSSQQPGYVDTPWRLANNNWRVLTATDAAAVYMALTNHVRQQFATFAALEFAVATSDDPGAILWPTTS
jgi:hypothetical protein